MRNMMGVLGIFMAAFALGGCTSMVTETAQMVRLETVDQQGNPVRGARCSLHNDRGNFSGESGTQILIRRSAKELVIECQKAGYADAGATATPRIDGLPFGHIVLGVGKIDEQNRNAAHAYPEWMRLVFGKTLSFDRSRDSEGKPSVAKQQADTNNPADPIRTEIAAVE